MFYEMIILVLSVFCIIFLYKIIVIKTTLKCISRQLESVSKKIKNDIIKISFVDRHVEEVAAEINNLIINYERKMSETRINEQKLKRQISDISHDLRTPLTSISGFLQLYESGNVSEKQKEEYIKIIKNKVQNLSGLMNSFFELAVLDSEDYVPKLEYFDFTCTLNNMIISNYSLIKAKGIEPVIDISNQMLFISNRILLYVKE